MLFTGKKFKKGFTLIELLIVISIIGLLAMVVLVSFPDTKNKARDATRLQDMSQILTAIRIYHADNDVFPPMTPDGCCGVGASGWDQGPCDGDNTFISALIDSGTIGAVPIDPMGGTGTGCYGYDYYVYNAGYGGCDLAKGKFFVLGIRDMESSDRPHPDSPNFVCNSAVRDWPSEFDWVTGGFAADY